MSPRSRRLAWIVAGVLVLATVLPVGGALVRGLDRYRAYSRVVERPGAHAALSAQVGTLECADEWMDTPPISLGLVRFQPESEVQQLHAERGVVHVTLADGSYTFMAPRNDAVIPSGDIGLERFWNEMERIAHVQPKSFLELLMLPEDEYAIYLGRIVVKCADRRNERGIARFGNDRIEALVQLGVAKGPQHRFCLVRSKASQVVQGVHVTGDDEASVERHTCALLSSYELVVPEIPGAAALEELVSRSIRAWYEERENR